MKKYTITHEQFEELANTIITFEKENAFLKRFIASSKYEETEIYSDNKVERIPFDLGEPRGFM